MRGKPVTEDDLFARRPLGMRMAMVVRQWRAIIDSAITDTGLTQSSWTVLMQLHQLGDNVSVSELAEVQGIELPPLMRTLSLLEKQGYLVRSTSPYDKRIRLLTLTAEGRAILEKLSCVIETYQERVTQTIPEADLATFSATLNQIACRLRNIREEDNKMQPATMMFKVGGVDYDRAVFLGTFEATYETENGELQALARQHIPHPAGHILNYRSTLPGVVTCNMTNVTGIDGTNAEDLTKATLACRRQLDSIIAYLRKFVPGYEKCFLLSSAALIGIRETRHFKGKYTLTGEDILDARVFEDYVVKDAYFNFDVHNITGAGLDKTGAQKYFAQTKGYTIPYRCLLPAVKQNLLLCGRNISGTHMAHSNFRVMPICVGIGEAAGTAAAMAALQHRDLNDITAEEIRESVGI